MPPRVTHPQHTSKALTAGHAILVALLSARPAALLAGEPSAASARQNAGDIPHDRQASVAESHLQSVLRIAQQTASTPPFSPWGRGQSGSVLRIAQETTSIHPSPPWGRGQGEGVGNAAVISAAILKRCQLVPLPGHQVSFQIDGLEKTRWHFGGEYPRPFFYPFRGPSGTSLTRMGHPGAENHDHHRSIWFAHQNVCGVDFWSDRTAARVRQKHWYCYHGGDDQAIMASLSGWYDGQGTELMEQDIVAALIPMDRGESALEIQITMRPPAEAEPVELGKTNFGFLAVRVAKTLSVHFGGGKLTNSEGEQGEESIFGKQARWVDYSGPVAVGRGPDRRAVVEGITYFDHAENPRYPTSWHVRDDGWMGASFCMHQGLTVTARTPLTLRYLLHAHRGAYDHYSAQSIHERFSQRPGFRIAKETRKHRQYQVERLPIEQHR